MRRTIWIVDGAYLESSSPHRFDYLRLKTWLEEQSGEEFVDSYYVNSANSNSSKSHESFHAWLKTAPPQGPRMRVKVYAIKESSCICPKCGHGFTRRVQKGVDVAIATLIVKLAAQDQYDRLVFSAGDGDFEDAAAFVRDECHKELWVTGFPDTVSPDLQSYANRMIWLDEVWESIRRTDA